MSTKQQKVINQLLKEPTTVRQMVVWFASTEGGIKSILAKLPARWKEKLMVEDGWYSLSTPPADRIPQNSVYDPLLLKMANILTPMVDRLSQRWEVQKETENWDEYVSVMRDIFIQHGWDVDRFKMPKGVFRLTFRLTETQEWWDLTPNFCGNYFRLLPSRV